MRTACLALLCLAAPLAADDDRDRKAKAALALARPGPSRAPAPRAAAQPYPEAYRDAAQDQRPLVVYVGCQGAHPVSGAVTARADAFGDVRGPAVVIGYPSTDGRLYVHDTLPCPVEVERLEKAVRDAARKIGGQPPKDAPAPKPLRWDV